MSEYFQPWWPILLAYVIGATPFGLIAGKLKGVDIRTQGSGNIGATNAVRVLGKPVGFTVLFLDILKGLVPVMIAQSLSAHTLVPILTAMAAILGHNYTFWLKFKGGKGIATTAGAALPVIPIALIAALIAWLITLKVTRYVSVSSLVAAITIPLVVVIESLCRQSWDFFVLSFALTVCLLAFWKHRANIQRLRHGQEPKVGEGKKQAKANS